MFLGNDTVKNIAITFKTDKEEMTCSGNAAEWSAVFFHLFHLKVPNDLPLLFKLHAPTTLTYTYCKEGIAHGANPNG